jgi:ATP-dependent DNA helicase
VSGREEDGENGVKEVVEEVSEGRARRKLGRIDYKIEENDSKFINDLQDGVAKEEASGVKNKAAPEVGQEWAYKQASKSLPVRAIISSMNVY